MLLWDKTLSWNAWFRDDTTLPRLKAAGYAIVGLTVGGGSSGRAGAIETLSAIHRMVEEQPSKYRIVRGPSDVDAALRDGQLALELNFQGSEPLEGRIEAIEEFHSLGVRQIGIVWNADNALGCSATSERDTGLTSLGRSMIHELSRAGIIVDGAHAGYRTTMDAMEVSERPFIFSHSNVNAIHASYKNLQDGQIRECAALDGVIGISGFGTYLDDPNASADAMFRQVDYVCDLVGPAHVGLGLDFVCDPRSLWEKVRAHPHLWPGVRESRFFPPEEIPTLTGLMARAGYTRQQIAGILGQNWKRVGDAVWSRRTSLGPEHG